MSFIKTIYCGAEETSVTLAKVCIAAPRVASSLFVQAHRHTDVERQRSARTAFQESTSLAQRNERDYSLANDRTKNHNSRSAV